MKHVYSHPAIAIALSTGISPFVEAKVEKPIYIRLLRNRGKFFNESKTPIQKEKDQRKGIYNW